MYFRLVLDPDAVSLRSEAVHYIIKILPIYSFLVEMIWVITSYLRPISDKQTMAVMLNNWHFMWIIVQIKLCVMSHHIKQNIQKSFQSSKQLKFMYLSMRCSVHVFISVQPGKREDILDWWGNSKCWNMWISYVQCKYLFCQTIDFLLSFLPNAQSTNMFIN